MENHKTSFHLLIYLICQLNIFHYQVCRKVYNIIAKYNTGDVTKEDAKKELADAVTHKTKFTKPIQDKVNEIMKEEQPKAKTKKIVTEN